MPINEKCIVDATAYCNKKQLDAKFPEFINTRIKFLREA